KVLTAPALGDRLAYPARAASPIRIACFGLPVWTPWSGFPPRLPVSVGAAATLCSRRKAPRSYLAEGSVPLPDPPHRRRLAAPAIPATVSDGVPHKWCLNDPPPAVAAPAVAAHTAALRGRIRSRSSGVCSHAADTAASSA